MAVSIEQGLSIAACTICCKLLLAALVGVLALLAAHTPANPGPQPMIGGLFVLSEVILSPVLQEAPARSASKSSQVEPSSSSSHPPSSSSLYLSCGVLASTVRRVPGVKPRMYAAA